MSLICSYVPSDESSPKPKGAIQWVPSSTAVPVEVSQITKRQIDYLIFLSIPVVVSVIVVVVVVVVVVVL